MKISFRDLMGKSDPDMIGYTVDGLKQEVVSNETISHIQARVTGIPGKKSTHWARIKRIPVRAASVCILIAFGVIMCITIAKRNDITSHVPIDSANIDETSSSSLTDKHSQPSSNGLETSENLPYVFFDQIEFEQTNNNTADRMGRDAESLLNSYDQDIDGKTAVCIVTLLNLETDQPETDLKIIPVEVRIDHIIKKTDSFALKEGDKFRTTDFSIWEKTGNGFKVRHPSYVPPLTEPGAQYIVFIYYRETNPYFEEIKYLTSPLTIPILRNGEALEDDIYEKMNLDDEARRCSEYLIQTYITDFSNE